jgi:short-subunit dehydrogenase
MKNLENLRIVITGASAGIGEATTLELARHNTRLVLIARDVERLRAVVNKVKVTAPDCPTPIIIPCDVRIKEDVKRMVETCRIIFGGVDVLINNAGCGIYGASELTSIEEFKNVMDTNFYGPLRCTYGLLPMMKAKNKGHIINVASVAACYGIPYLGAYGASKAALATINQSLRAELFNTNIKISIIYPGYTDTPFFDNEKKIGSAVRPDKPYVPAEEVARSITSMISKGSGDQVLTIEGKILFLLKTLFPRLLLNPMKKMALKLQS